MDKCYSEVGRGEFVIEMRELRETLHLMKQDRRAKIPQGRLTKMKSRVNVH
jgi:hypothetical protein